MIVRQGEGGGVIKSRRNGARLFKDPPQPHMCIQDYIQGSWNPCYVNVLSWGKIAMPHHPSQPVPLWGGMKIPPPRTEKPQCAVFAVMVNPEILRLNGKNAQDPQERSVLIDLLLDFVEAMNEGVVFTRCYTVLKDRDITGELKEVWMAVQMKRDREQETQQETWIDVQPPAPQYSQFEMARDYSYQLSNEQIHSARYQSGHIVTQQYHANVQPQIAPDQYNYGDRGRQQNSPQNQAQQNCPAYPTPQYQFQQLPRQLLPQYINSNVHPNVAQNVSPSYPNPSLVNSNVNPNIPGHYQQYIALQQQMTGQRQIDNAMHTVRDVHTELHHQGHVTHMQSKAQYEQSMAQLTSQMKLRLGRPHMGVTQKSNANKWQRKSSLNSKQPNLPAAKQYEESEDDGWLITNKGSRVRKVSKDQGSLEKQNTGQPLPAKTKEVKEESGVEDGEFKNIQVTDLDEDEIRGDDSADKKPTGFTETAKEHGESSAHHALEREGSQVKPTNKMGQQIPNSSDHITALQTDSPPEGSEYNTPNQNVGSKKGKMQILVLKRNSTKSNNNDTNKAAAAIGDEKSINQMKNNDRSTDSDAIYQKYAILRKGETKQDDMIRELAQIITDCKETTEASTVQS